MDAGREDEGLAGFNLKRSRSRSLGGRRRERPQLHVVVEEPSIRPTCTPGSLVLCELTTWPAVRLVRLRRGAKAGVFGRAEGWDLRGNKVAGSEPPLRHP